MNYVTYVYMWGMDLRDLYCKEIVKYKFHFKLILHIKWSVPTIQNGTISVFNFPFLLNCLTDETGKHIYNQMVTFHHNLNFKRRN